MLREIDRFVDRSGAVRQAEVGAKAMLDRTAEQFEITAFRLAADAGYGSAKMLGWLVDARGIEPHVKVFDKSEHRTARSRATTSPTIAPFGPRRRNWSSRAAPPKLPR
jgi:hypothetical protein